MSDRREQGVALIWAIIIMVIVMGILAIVSISTLGTSQNARDATSRTRAVFWAEAASKDLLQRFSTGELGPWVTSQNAAGDQYLAFASHTNPVGMGTPTTTTFPMPGSGSTRAIPITSTGGGVTQRGWYQVLSPTAGAPEWTGMKIRSNARTEDQGAIQFVVRTWNDARNAKPLVVRMELRRGTLSRFSLLSEDELVLGGIGTLRLGGAIHTNNARSASTAVRIGTNTDIGSVSSLTTTSGSISGCTIAARCQANIGDVVGFGSANRAMHHVARLHALGRCNTTSFGACSFTGLASAGTRIPAWRVELNAPGGCVTVRRIQFPVRTDTGVYPMLDDRLGPTGTTTTTGTYCPARGGGAMVFDGDVVVTGLRAATAPAVTIMARRTTAFPTVSIGGGSRAVTAPASIYVQQSSATSSVGATSAREPVGLVAQGGVYLPSWAMRTVNNNLRMVNVAVMAVTGEMSYSPSLQAVAADGTTPGGLGITPGVGRTLGYGYGTSFTFDGSIASGGRMMFRYGQNADYLGYGSRTLRYVPSLMWNAPPWFPTDVDWHLADWTEFDQ